MSTTASSTPTSNPTDTSQCLNQGSFNLGEFFDCLSNLGDSNSDQDAGQLWAAISAAFISLGAQLLIFVLLRLRLSRIYRPRSYLVPERERVPPPPQGIVGWLYPLFTTTNLALIQKCGLDAYFFLRFLRMLLKIFLPTAVIALPVLLPLNSNGEGGNEGLSEYSISNIGPSRTGRLWAHCILAIMFISWFCYVTFEELRGYIRVRQSYLTSPQHRIRASATTVLVTGIPRKWLTLEALSGLYDVFPGGIRNIWINRNFDALLTKVQLRDEIARDLEGAETSLIRLCRKKHMEAEAKRAKKEGRKAKTKQEKTQDRADEDAAAERTANAQGTSAGEQHEVPHAVQEILDEEERLQEQYNKRPVNPLGAVGHGLGNLGRGVGRLGGKVVGGVDSGIHRVGDDLNRATATANDGGLGGGFVIDDSLYQDGENASKDKAEFHGKAPASAATTDRLPTPQQDSNASPALQTTTNGLRHSLMSENTLDVPTVQLTRPSADSRPKSSLQIEEPPSHQSKRLAWNFFKNHDKSIVFPSPQPHAFVEDDEFPLRANGANLPAPAPENVSKSKWLEKLAFWKNGDENTEEKYTTAVNKQLDEDPDGEPYWRRFVEPKDRDTIRLHPITWLPIPFVGKKVDKIYHLRRELARLNLEIETDQNDVEKFPLMNSAFIQFNHQVAAHMCCQSISHHVPQQMAPRLVEISPDDVIWDNMSINWWERYLRSTIVLAVCIALIIFYAIPVAFTSLLNNIKSVAQLVPWLQWLNNAPTWIKDVIQGILPPVLLNLLLLLIPIIFRTLVRQQGVPTGNAKEMGVQAWYFAFLFIQVFLVVTIFGGLVNFFTGGETDANEIVRSLATNLPKASNYFFSYLTIQALSNSASALLQIGSLFGWFILAPMMDSTARAKWRRQTSLNNQQWGSFFPPFTNFAAIGLIYSIIAPLILVFMLFIFSLFWIVHRYNVLFVYRFTHDTGGLLFPTAIHQLFTGIYFLELCLIALFFTLTDEQGNQANLPQAIIMIIAMIATATYQYIIYRSFKPLSQYLPITLEDEAVIRDEQFAKAQASKFAPLREGEGEESRDIEDVLHDRERAEEEEDRTAEKAEKLDIERHRHSRTVSASLSPEAVRRASTTPTSPPRWQDRKESKPMWATEAWKKVAPEAVSALRYLADGKHRDKEQASADMEAQHTVGDVLFSGFADELEDLSPDDRDLLVRYAFQHSALRARRPVVWIPRDSLGVSDDEIKRAQKMSTVEAPSENGGKQLKTWIWMSNEGTALDSKGRVVFRKSPPDFSNVDLIAL